MADKDPLDLARFLKRLDPSEPNGGREYQELLARMAAFFKHRNCSGPDGLAADVVYRVGRKLATEKIDDLKKYCGGTARLLILEEYKEKGRTPFIADLSKGKQDIPDPRQEGVEAKIDQDRMVDCVRRCVAALNPESQWLVTEYYDSYSGEQIKLRDKLAKILRLKPGTLRKRMSDLRDELKLCATKCKEFLPHV